MAPSSGHVLLPKVLTAFKYAVSRTAQAVRARLAQQGGAAQPIAIPIRTGQPLHPLAVLKKAGGQSRNFSTGIRKALVETYPCLRTTVPSRASFPLSRTSKFISRTPSAASFASTLRPNLTGGALPRTAGGYGNIGGKRMFSSVPGSQAQVVHNVSAGMRAFWLGGQRGQFDGLNSVTGEKRFVAIGTKQEDTARKVLGAQFNKETRGTTVEFCVAPSLTAFRTSKEDNSVGLDDAIAPLASDFARNLGVLAAVHGELKKLSALGNLPITEPRPGWLAVRFPGCDGRTVESLCDELGIFRGIVREDDAWAEEQAQDVKMALLFPTAPSEEDDEDIEAYFYPTKTPSKQRNLSLADESYTAEETLSSLGSLHDPISAPHSFEHISQPHSVVSWQENPWAKEERSDSDRDEIVHDAGGPSKMNGAHDMDSIYKFLAECDGRLK